MEGYNLQTFLLYYKHKGDHKKTWRGQSRHTGCDLCAGLDSIEGLTDEHLSGTSETARDEVVDGGGIWTGHDE